MERLGACLGVAAPFDPGPEGFERQVRGSLPVALARRVVGGSNSLNLKPPPAQSSSAQKLKIMIIVIINKMGDRARNIEICPFVG